MSAELNINWTRCQGRGVCIELLANSLTSDPWGYPLPINEQATGSKTVHIDEDQVLAAREAVKMCPLSALTMHEGRG